MKAMLILLCLYTSCYSHSTSAVESPAWWQNNRAIYASFDLSGAGGPLMKFPSQDIKKKLKGSFENLPVLLQDARQLDCNCVYLVSYWEPNYENKGDYEIRLDLGGDGFHLDSYGIQWDLKDHDPRHKGSFNQGAIELVIKMRNCIRKINPDAVIILEGCERTQLLDLCDGGQIESAAWQYSPIKVLNEKPWVKDKKYKVFTSHYSMAEMDKILSRGYNLSLSPWWFEHHIRDKDFATMQKRINDDDDWLKRIRILWNWDNLCYINNIPRPTEIDLFQLRRDLEMHRYARPKPDSFCVFVVKIQSA
jgi:hypothetical protein